LFLGSSFERYVTVNHGDLRMVEPVEIVEAFFERVPVMAEIIRQWNCAGEESEEFRFAGNTGRDDNAEIVIRSGRLGFEVKGIHGSGMKV